MAFSWLDRTDRPHAADSRARGTEVAREEVASRAALFFRLGYTVEAATARLVAQVAWEFEQTSKNAPDRRPEALSDAAIGKIVTETYARRPG
ncbi:MAG TPA: hypothetical protein VIU61_04560 [Kofleriaceae bacterium]